MLIRTALSSTCRSCARFAPSDENAPHFTSASVVAFVTCRRSTRSQKSYRLVNSPFFCRSAMMFSNREMAEAGGLMSYGPSFPALFGRLADYVDRIAKGAKPGDLPVEQPTKFELVVNLKTARTLGLTIPPSLLLRTDHVIE